MKKARLVAGALCASGALILACSSDQSDKPNAPVQAASGPTNDAGPNDALNLPYNPTFEPDYNRLVANPSANHVSDTQRNKVTVTPTSLVFDSADADEVRYWEPGRIVVSEPGAGTGVNPLGFARRVVSVAEANGKVTVTTVTVGLEDVVSGDFQVRYDSKAAKPVDLSKLDLQWAAKNLYHNGGFPGHVPGNPLVDNTPPVLHVHSVPGQPGWFTDAVHGLTELGSDMYTSASAGVDTVVDDTETAIADLGNLLPSDFSGSVNIGDTLSGNGNLPLFSNLDIEIPVNGKGNLPMVFAISGSGSVQTTASFTPGFQIGASIPDYLAPNPSPFSTWINVDSQASATIHFNAALTAELKSASGLTDSDLQKAVNAGTTAAEDILAAEHESLFGDPALKSGDAWTKTLYLSNPSVTTFFAGPVPVVITSTVQVDLVCGFQAKATIHADIESITVNNFKFSASYNASTGATSSTPVFTSQNSKSVNLDGSGSIMVSCGLTPRINTFLYDTVGLNVGVNTALVAQADYGTTCSKTTTKPTGQVDLGLAVDYSVEVGARFQAPGSSAAGVKGEAAGVDIGPVVVASGGTTLGEWSFPAPGYGLCTPLCKNGILDPGETDVDCGGGACGGCLDTKKCTVNTDCQAPGTCNSGVCKVDPCGDRVKDADESDVDCGGAKCAPRCGQSNWCEVNSDCDKGLYCASDTKTCVTTTCSDGLKDGTETGVDCGGPTCAKCGTGVASSDALSCLSGLSNGTYCIANPCQNRVKDANESGVDCGSPSTNKCGRCGSGQGCNTNDDCLNGFQNYYCSPTHVCAINPAPNCFDGVLNNGEGDIDCGGTCAQKCDDGKRCTNSASCTNGNCIAGVCSAAACNDGIKNGSEGDIDCGVVCPGKACADGKGCGTNKDCASSTCDPDNGICQPATSCFDQVKNGGEADVDCGGPCNNPCEDGKTCKTFKDCFDENCVNGVCQSALPKGVVFITTQTYKSLFGGLDGADAACQAAGDAQGFKNVTWKAWLSDSTSSASARMTHRAGGYQLIDGTLLAATADEFFSFAHRVPIDITEAGVKLTSINYVWTGTSANAMTGNWCNGWTKQTGDLPAIGESDAINGSWTSSSQPSFCDGVYHLYCVMQ